MMTLLELLGFIEDSWGNMESEDMTTEDRMLLNGAREVRRQMLEFDHLSRNETREVSEND